MILNNPTTMLWGVIASSVVMGLLAVAFAAWLQIGYRESGRPTEKIYCHHIDISTTYPKPFSLKNALDL